MPQAPAEHRDGGRQATSLGESGKQRKALVRRTPLRSKRPTNRSKPWRKFATAADAIAWLKSPTRKKKRTQASKTTLMRRADKLARELILRRAGGRCEHCGQEPRPGDPLQWCHIFTRRRYVLRWDPDGALGMLASCHRRFTSDPEAWRQFNVNRLGELGYADLYMRSQQTMGGRITVGHYRELIADLTVRLER